METPSSLPPKKKRGFFYKYVPMILVIVVLILIAVPLGFLISSKKADLEARQSKESGGPKSLTNVVIMEIAPKMIQEKISFPGIAKPWITLQVVSEVRGKTIEKTAIEGHRVEKGDVLAVIDKSDYQNSYDSALASYETALSTQKRLSALVKKDFVTQSQLDDAVAGVKTSKAALELAKLNLSRCTIRSPMKGIVNQVYIENGTYMNPGDPVCQILQIDKLKIEVGIPESDVDAVRKLSTFEMTIDALDEKTYTGRYHYLYKTADPMARLYSLEIEVDNPGLMILPDMFARVTIVKQQDPEGIAVPMYSLIEQNESKGVFVEKNNTVNFCRVETGFQDGWSTQVKKGLAKGDRVVVVGHRIIEDGETVNVTRTIRDMEELYQ